MRDDRTGLGNASRRRILSAAAAVGDAGLLARAARAEMVDLPAEGGSELRPVTTTFLERRRRDRSGKLQGMRPAVALGGEAKGSPFKRRDGEHGTERQNRWRDRGMTVLPQPGPA